MSGEKFNGSILFVISGLGLGNSTRCLAIMEELSQWNMICHVATFGNGLDFFRAQPEIKKVIPLRSIKYHRLKRFGFILVIFQFLFSSIMNEIRILKFVYRHRPQLIVYDSVYGFLPKIIFRLPQININHSNQIVKRVWQKKSLPLSRWAHFLLVECLDYIFHLFIPDWVLSPWPTLSDDINQEKRKRLISIGPIVRSGIQPRSRFALSPISSNRDLPKILKILIVPTGSRLHQDLEPLAKKLADLVQGEVIGSARLKHRKKKKQKRNNIDNINLINSCDFIVGNGGLSSVSESLKRQVPMVAVPLAHHSEQWVNAQRLEELGTGFMVKEGEYHFNEDQKKKIKALVEKFNHENSSITMTHFQCDGAKQAALFIKSKLMS